jgi:hydroxyacylglutathione hydrolase
MIHEILRVGPLQYNCSILGDEISREATVVDPGDDIPAILRLVAKHGLTVKQILVTHAHIDHIAGAHRLKQLTGAPVFYNQLDLPLVAMMDLQAAWLGIEPPTVQPPDADLPDLASVRVGGIAATVHHTPGHSQGSLCLHLPSENLLIAGDTLFAGSIGRTDLPGGDLDTLLRSVHERLLTLPDATVVIPGHGRSTTIGQERAFNPFLQEG